MTVEARPLSLDVLSTAGAGTQTSGRAGEAWSSDRASELGLHHRLFLAGAGAGTEAQALPSSLPGRGCPEPSWRLMKGFIAKQETVLCSLKQTISNYKTSLRPPEFKTQEVCQF